jgi:hypothetical protein
VRGLSVQTARRRARRRTSGKSSPKAASRSAAGAKGSPPAISRIGHSRDLPVAPGFGKCGAITRHSASVRSVWYRVTMRLCCRRVVGVLMANPSWFKKPFGITAAADESIFSETTTDKGRRD